MLSEKEQKVPDVPTWLMPGYSPLSSEDDIGKAAVAGQVVEYPKIVRKSIDPVIKTQQYGNVSFMLFETPKSFRNKPIYGFVKLRGNHDSVESAKEGAYKIVREVDSKFQVRIASVGEWVPITDNDSVVHDLYDIRESDNEIHLRDEAVKGRERESKRIASEIKEAEKKLKDGGDLYDDPESIRFYTMKRVTDMTLSDAYKAQLLKLEELDKKVGEQRIILKKLEQTHPDYSDKWVDVYNEERKKTSLSIFIPGETQFSEYESLTLEDLFSKYKTPKPEATGKSSTSENITNNQK